MAQRFLKKVIVIVGGASGIGLATALAFSAEGAKVIISGRDVGALRSAERRIGKGASGIRCDVSAVEQIGEFFASVKAMTARIDVLFVNAGILALMPIESVTEADWDAVQDTNVKGAFFSVQRALPLMSRGSAVVITSSVAAHRGISKATTYCASKAALCALGRSLAAELVERGIRVNTVSPGLIDTPIFGRTRGLPREAESAVRRQEVDCVPMRRMGTPEEVASTVLFLASDCASFITGADLLVDGGCAHFPRQRTVSQ
jgi:NAD(P)-dependent dehydrogenase (short-subunit alcohol dehydrogenase family)